MYIRINYIKDLYAQIACHIHVMVNNLIPFIKVCSFEHL